MRATGATTDDFNISLKQPLTLTNSNNFFRLHLEQAVIPHCIRQINNSNNVLTFTFNRDGSFYSSFITLTSGNYNILTLNEELRTKLISKIFFISTENVVLSFTYDKTTGYDTFSIIGTDNVPTSITLNFDDNLLLGKFFGFTSTSTAYFRYNASNISFNATSSQNVNVNQINSLYIRSSTLVQRESYENIIEKDVYSDIICQIPITVLPGSFIFFTNSSPTIDIKNNIIDTINIYLSDNNSYSLSLNGLDWSCVLIFEEWGNSKNDILLNQVGELPAPEILSNEN